MAPNPDSAKQQSEHNQFEVLELRPCPDSRGSSFANISLTLMCSLLKNQLIRCVISPSRLLNLGRMRVGGVWWICCYDLILAAWKTTQRFAHKGNEEKKKLWTWSSTIFNTQEHIFEQHKCRRNKNSLTVSMWPYKTNLTHSTKTCEVVEFNAL